MSPAAEIIGRLVACGLNSAGMTAQHEPNYDYVIVTLAPLSGASEAQFDCILMAVGPDVKFTNREVGNKFKVFVETETSKMVRSEATKWLKANKKYDGAPLYSAGQNLREFSRSAERFCGFNDGEMLHIMSARQIVLKPLTTATIDDVRLGCLLNVLSLSNFKAAGIEIGFIGNEAYVDEAK